MPSPRSSAASLACVGASCTCCPKSFVFDDDWAQLKGLQWRITLVPNQDGTSCKPVGVAHGSILCACCGDRFTLDQDTHAYALRHMRTGGDTYEYGGAICFSCYDKVPDDRFGGCAELDQVRAAAVRREHPCDLCVGVGLAMAFRG